MGNFLDAVDHTNYCVNVKNNTAVSEHNELNATKNQTYIQNDFCFRVFRFDPSNYKKYNGH